MPFLVSRIEKIDIFPKALVVVCEHMVLKVYITSSSNFFCKSIAGFLALHILWHNMQYDLVVLLFTDRCFSNMRQISSLFGIHIDKWSLLEICLKAKDIVCILTWYIESYLLMIYQSFTNHLPIYQFLVILLITCQSFTNLLPTNYQLFSNAIFVLLTLPFVYESIANQPHPFYCIGHFVAVATTLICCTNVVPNITNLIQCFTWPVYWWLPTNGQYIITSHNIGNFLHIGNKCFVNQQFTKGIWKFTNNFQWFIIGSYWQWYTAYLKKSLIL